LPGKILGEPVLIGGDNIPYSTSICGPIAGLRIRTSRPEFKVATPFIPNKRIKILAKKNF